MARPTQDRLVAATPNATRFAPRGVPEEGLGELSLALEELEALRLADMEGLTAIAAAEHMGVSRHTFGRILVRARRTVATVLCRGLALRVEGGHYSLAAEVSCPADLAGRVAVSCTGPTPDAVVAPLFGRSGGFLLVDLPEMRVSYLYNIRTLSEDRGAGLATVRALAGAGVGVVIGRVIGARVFHALREAGIQVCLNAEGTMRAVLSHYCEGALPFADQPNRD